MLHVSKYQTLNVSFDPRLIIIFLWAQQVHLKFDINPYDPAILRQLIRCGGEQSQQTLTESRRPTLAWLESSSCSDLPKLEGDR